MGGSMDAGEVPSWGHVTGNHTQMFLSLILPPFNLSENKNIFNLLFKDFIYLFLERLKGGRERETSMCGFFLLAPLLGTWLATQACSLTGNPTGDPLVHRPALNSLSHTSQGCSTVFK